MATNTAFLEAIISADLSQFDSELDRSVNRLLNTANAFDRVGKSLTAKITVPFAALSSLLVKTASDIEELSNKFNVVFGDLSEETTEWAIELGESLNRSRYDIQEFSASLQDTFKPLGFVNKEAQELSKNLVELALNVASFQNKADADVIRDFQSALVGSSETVQKYGIIINEQSIQQQAYIDGINKTYSELTNLEKVQLRYNIILGSTTDAVGDIARSSGSFSNQLKGLQADIKDVAVEFGEELLPVATDAVKGLRDFVDSFKGLDTETKKAILSIGGFLAVLGPALLAISGLIKAVAGLKVAFTGLGLAVSAIGGPLTILAGVLATGIIAWNDYNKSIEKAEASLKRVQSIELGDNWKKEEAGLRELNDSYLELKARADELGVSLGFLIELDEVDADIKKHGKSMKELADDYGVTERSMNLTLGKLERDSQKWAESVRENFGTLESYIKAGKSIEKGLKAQAEAIEEARIQTELLNSVSERWGQTLRDEDTQLRSIITSQNDYRDNINQIADTFRYLTEQEELNAEQQQQLITLQNILTDAFGVNAGIIDKNTGKISLNEDALKRFNDELVNSIALTQETIVVNIETRIKAGAEEFLKVDNEIRALEKQLQNTRSLQQAEFLDKEIKKLKEYRATVKAETEANIDFQKKQERDLAAEIASNLNSVVKASKKAKTERVKTAEELAREQEQILRESVNAELAILNYRYNVEEISQTELIEGLKKNLEDYSNFYESNLQEELSLRQQIFSIEKQLQEKNISEQVKLLDKANDSVLDSLKERKNIIDDNHKDNLKLIEEERDAKIKAIEDEIDAQERLVQKGRLEDRINEINAVIDSYRKSTTAEGQARFKQLLEEREDIELKLRKDTADAQVKIIEANAEAEISEQNKRYEAEKELIDNQINFVESQYNKIFNNLKGITDEATAETAIKVEEFKNQLVSGLENAFISAQNVIQSSLNIDVPISDVSLPESQVNFAVPERARQGDIYNITNNVNVSNVFNIETNGEGLDFEEVSTRIAEEISIQIKEVL